MRDKAVSGFQSGDRVRDGHVKQMHSAPGYVPHEHFEAQLAQQGAWIFYGPWSSFRVSLQQ
jgi:hypothetical protein